eukprot:TRINITY_DN9653_c0_g1_i1.p1 TRINITY_DN9653_c0_g1~~TRINITY_DN9653_c0_g1_i1.p1  ORF type:complete len:282 (+),score=37.29 TRINITY_DN9653_c0_g1_i1:171-1016(+)
MCIRDSINAEYMGNQLAVPQNQQLLTSLIKYNQVNLMKQSLEDKYQSQVDQYLFEIGRYCFIGDALDLMKGFNIEQSKKLLIQYILCKTLIFYAKKVENSLALKQNTFNVENFPEFVESNDANLLLSKVSVDLKNWTQHLVLFFYSINQEIVPNDLKGVITQDVFENNFEKEIKIALRTILDPCFRACYKQGKKIDNNPTSVTILRLCLFILLCMLINSVFEQTQSKKRFREYHKIHDKFNFWNFSIWILENQSQILLSQIDTIIEIAFGKDKLKIFQQQE